MLIKKNFDPAEQKHNKGKLDKKSPRQPQADTRQMKMESVLFENREANIITRPKICRQIGKKEMAVYGERGRYSRFGKLKF